jgi:hypothetical protein
MLVDLKQLYSRKELMAAHKLWLAARMQRLANYRMIAAVTVALVIALTIALLVTGLLDTAAQVAAYATVVLAVGTIGLSVGAIGTYVEQRKTNQDQADQLDRAHHADLAQVRVERLSGPGEFLQVAVYNGSSRAITNVYVWAECVGGKGLYHAAVQRPSGDLDRRMRNVPRPLPDLYWQYRVIHPGERKVFTQLRDMSDQRPVAALADSDITAWAQFQDVYFTWWACDEDGDLVNVSAPSHQPIPELPIEAAKLFGSSTDTSAQK